MVDCRVFLPPETLPFTCRGCSSPFCLYVVLPSQFPCQEAKVPIAITLNEIPTPSPIDRDLLWFEDGVEVAVLGFGEVVGEAFEAFVGVMIEGVDELLVAAI
jgi:hypothetical protein